MVETLIGTFPEEDVFMTISEAASHLHVSDETVRTLHRDGKLHACVTMNGYRIYRHSEVERVAAERRANPPRRGGYRPRHIGN